MTASTTRLTLDPLRVVLWLFAFWVFANFVVRFAILLYAENVLDIATGIEDRDFANYWIGGKLVLNGNFQLLFHHDDYYSYLQAVFGREYQIHSWSYPPHFLLLVAPLGFFDYKSALVLFLAATFVLFMVAVIFFRRRLAADVSTKYLWLALFGYVMLMIETTQNGFLTAAMALCALAFMRDRPIVAGLALALLTVKPQLGFLIPLLALFDRNWALLKWATIFTVLLIAASVACFGIESWRDYFTQVVPYQKFVMTDWTGIFLFMMPSAFGSARALGFTPDIAFTVQLAFSAIGFGAMVWLIAKLAEPLDRLAALMLGTFLITPYSFNYDMGPLAVICACLALRGSAVKDHARTIAFTAIAVLPACLTKLGLKGFPIAPLVMASGLVVLWISARSLSTPNTSLQRVTS